MASDPVVDHLAKALAERDEEELAEVISLLEVMPESTVGLMLPRLELVKDRKRRRWACDVMTTWAPTVDAAIAALPQSSEEVALDILYLVRRIGSPAAATALERATHHTAAPVRASALRLFVEVSATAAIGPRTRAALRDPDPLVRASALEQLVERRPDGCLTWIKISIDDEAFSTLDVGEKKRLLVAYALIGGDAVGPELIARLEQRNLLQRTSVDEERAAAAAALGQLQYQDAQPILERMSNAMLVRSIVKLACREALDDLDRPPRDAHPPRFEPIAALTPAPPPAPTMTSAFDEPVNAADLPVAPQVSFKAPSRPIPTVAESAPPRSATPTADPRTPLRPAAAPADPRTPVRPAAADPRTPVRAATPTADPRTPVRAATPTADPRTPVRAATPTADPRTPVRAATPTADPRTPVRAASPTADPRTPARPVTIDPRTPARPVTIDPRTPVRPATPSVDPRTPVRPSTPTADPRTPVRTATPDPRTPPGTTRSDPRTAVRQTAPPAAPTTAPLSEPGKRRIEYDDERGVPRSKPRDSVAPAPTPTRLPPKKDPRSDG